MRGMAREFVDQRVSGRFDLGRHCDVAAKTEDAQDSGSQPGVTGRLRLQASKDPPPVETATCLSSLTG